MQITLDQRGPVRGQQYQQGMTLIELFVGMVIGLLLTGAMIQVYLSSKETYRISQSVGRIQEDTRFAYFFITRDLRETTHMGCLRSIRNMTPPADQSNMTDLTIKVGGWDHSGTSPGDTAVDVATTYNVPTSHAAWSGLDTGGSTQSPNSVKSIEDSDSLAVKLVRPLEGAILSAGGTVDRLDASSYGSAKAGDMMIVGNCQKADQFIVNANTTGDIIPKGSLDFQKDWDAGARLYSVSNVLYYVGLRSGADVPSLFRVDSAAGAVAEEMVEGVESMQVLYGVDTDADGTANRYRSARDVVDWRTIVSVRVGLLMISPGGAGNTDGLAKTYNVTDGIEFTSPANDRDLRYTTSITVDTRNLGLSEDFSVCDASTQPLCDTNGYVVVAPPPPPNP